MIPLYRREMLCTSLCFRGWNSLHIASQVTVICFAKVWPHFSEKSCSSLISDYAEWSSPGIFFKVQLLRQHFIPLYRKEMLFIQQYLFRVELPSPRLSSFCDLFHPHIIPPYRREMLFTQFVYIGWNFTSSYLADYSLSPCWGLWKKNPWPIVLNAFSFR